MAFSLTIQSKGATKFDASNLRIKGISKEEFEEFAKSLEE